MDLQQLKQQLAKPVSGQILALFRIAFGLFMAFEMLYYMKINLVRDGLLAPKVLFTYDYLEFIKPLGESSMNALLMVLLACSLLIASGLLYRVASAVFFMGFIYLVLLDKGIWNNHMYLFALLSFIFIFINADRCYTLKSFFKGDDGPIQVPYWNILLLRLQIFIVYFFGGLAKLNYDWLVLHQPMHTALLSHNIDIPILSAFMAYGGLLFDLGVGIALFSKAWRKWALPLILFFNITNAFMFNDIGIFPFVMLATTIIFWDAEDFAWLQKSNPAKKQKKEAAKPKAVSSAPATLSLPVVAFLILYLSFQLIFPLRYLVLPNDVDWTGVGNYFAWRMKIQTREIKEFGFLIEDSVSQKSYPVPVQKLINPLQIQIACKDPRVLIPFAQMVKQEAAKEGIKVTSVRAKIKVAFNGHTPAYVVDSNTNLLHVTYSPFKKMEWVKPEPK